MGVVDVAEARARRPRCSRARRSRRRRRRSASSSDIRPAPQMAFMTFCACLGKRLSIDDDHAVVEAAGLGQVVVDDVGHGHLDQRQEDALGGLADPGRPPAAGARRRSTGSSGSRCRIVMQSTVRAGNGSTRRVEAGVVAERALRAAARRARASPPARPRRGPAPAAAPSGSRPSRYACPRGTRRTGTRRCRRAAARVAA